MAPFWGCSGALSGSSSKRRQACQRLNVLAALNATTHDIFTVQHLTYVTAATVCELLRLLTGAYPGQPITIILDNAPYQRCALVQEIATRLGVALLFLPSYSPNLNLIERLWKFVKKRCLYGKYYAESAAFQQAILACIAQARQACCSLAMKRHAYSGVRSRTRGRDAASNPWSRPQASAKAIKSSGC